MRPNEYGSNKKVHIPTRKERVKAAVKQIPSTPRSKRDPFSPDPRSTKKNTDRLVPKPPKQVIGKTAGQVVGGWRSKAHKQAQAASDKSNKRSVAQLTAGYKTGKPAAKAAPKRSNASSKGHSSAPASRSGRSSGGSRGSSGASGASKSGSSSKYSGPSQNDLLSRANSSVDLMLNPKLNELRRLLDTVNTDYTQGVNDTNKQEGRQVSDLKTAYGQLDTALQGLKQSGQQAFDTGAQNVNQNYNQLDSALQQITQRQQQGAGDELSRLGITNVNGDQLNADSAFMQGLAQQNRAQAAQLFAANKANAGAVADAQRGDAQFSGTQAQAQAHQAASDLLGQLLQQKNAKSADINSQYADVAGQRGTLLQQMLQQQEQQQYERMMEQQQQDFMNQMSVNRFNLDSDKFNAQTAYQNAQLALKGQTGASGAKNMGYGKGYAGASAYLDAQTPDAAYANALKSILQQVDTHTQKNVPGNINNFNQTSYGDFGKIIPYMYNYLNDPGYTQYNNDKSKSLLSNALRAYFGQL